MNDDSSDGPDASEEDIAPTSTLNFNPNSGGGDDGGDGWMVSYADMMTLIACFFILMMVFANYDAASFQRQAETMAKYFQGENDVSESKLSTSIKSQLKLITNISENIEVREMSQGVEVVINIKALFSIGSANLNPDYLIIFSSIINKIKEVDEDVRIVVEGHTDDIPFKSSSRKGFQNNWQLSGARAATVAKIFDDKGFDRESIVAAGFADTRPAFPNRDKKGIPIPANQQKNRRIVIKVYKRPKASKHMGLGVLFQENQANQKNMKKADNQKEHKVPSASK